MIISDLDHLEIAPDTSYIVKGGLNVKINAVLVRQKSATAATSLAFFGDATSVGDSFSGIFFS